MSSLVFLTEPTSAVVTERRLKLKSKLTMKQVMALPHQCDEMGARAERAYARLGVRVRFFDVDGFGSGGYKLEIGTGGIIICATSSRGHAAGSWTLQQIMLQHPQELPCGVFAGKPDVELRACYLSLRCQKFKPAYLKSVMTDLTRLSYNALIIDYHDTFPYKKEPCITGNVRYQSGQIADIRHAAKAHGLELIPSLPVIGGLDYVAQLQPYATLRGSAGAGVLDVKQPAAVKLLAGLIDELVQAHDAKHVCLHVTTPMPDLAQHARALGELTAGLVKRSVTPIVFIVGGVEPALLEQLADGTVVGVAGSAAVMEDVIATAHKRGLRTMPGICVRSEADREWAHTPRPTLAAIAKYSKHLKEAIGACVWCPPSGAPASPNGPLGTPVSLLRGARYTHLATLWLDLACVARVLWNTQGYSESALLNAWPLLWYGVHDERYTTLQMLTGSDPCNPKQAADAAQDRKHVVKMVTELKPLLHAEHLPFFDFYARLAMHANHVQQAFAHSIKKQQRRLLEGEIVRLRAAHKTLMSSSFFHAEIAEELEHLFGHTEMLLKRLTR
jgi:hypothetical protein